MRGKVNDDGYSPFWNAVGKKFMDIEFLEADYLSMKSKQFIEDLLPQDPIAVNLLPEDAQEVIGEVHPLTVPAKRILEKEGFHFNNLVGIFEPGPILQAKLDDVRAVKESKVVTIKEISIDDFDSDTFIISTNGDAMFKACLGKVKILEDGTAMIQAVTATALKLRLGENFRYVSLRP
jgi:arginine N-succinyltransferase